MEKLLHQETSIKVGPNISEVFEFDPKTRLKRPLFSTGISAGFPSPADDYIEKKLDLNEHLIKNPAATFFVKVSGESMTGSGIHHDDLLIVDRSLIPANNKVVIAVLDGELTVKRLIKKGNFISLIADNPDYEPLEIIEGMHLEIWGVVSYVIHAV